MRIGIVGAGIAGLSCADALARQGHQIELFDKGRRPGGRLSTRHHEEWSWDFGTQYFTLRDHRFAEWVDRMVGAGHVARWANGPEGAYVGIPDMASLVASMSENHAVQFSRTIMRCEQVGESWQLRTTEAQFGPYDALILAIPAEQAAILLATQDLAMAREAASARSLPCWTVMLGFAEPVAGLGDFERAAGPIAWAARSSSKPERGEGESWVIQASAGWSQAHLDMAPEQVAEELTALFAATLGVPLPEPAYAKAHRWRFAMTASPRAAALWNPGLRLGACGDWCRGARVEDAWLSGLELAETMLGEEPVLRRAGAL